jgi:putative transposase
MLRIQLTAAQRSELRAVRRSDLPAAARDRLEVVLLSDAGWSPPRIAAHLGRHPHTVRAALKGFRDRGTAAFRPDRPGPEPEPDRRAAVTGKLAELLGQDRTWTSRQLAEALRPDVGIGHRQTRRYLALLKAGYRRTAQTVGHKQDPKKVGRAEVVLAGLKKKSRTAGSGCSTWTSPGSARRCRPGTRGACPGNASGCGTSTRRAGG